MLSLIDRIQVNTKENIDYLHDSPDQIFSKHSKSYFKFFTILLKVSDDPKEVSSVLFFDTELLKKTIACCYRLPADIPCGANQLMIVVIHGTAL